MITDTQHARRNRFAALAVGALLLAGCGSSGSDEADVTTTKAPTTTEAETTTSDAEETTTTGSDADVEPWNADTQTHRDAVGETFEYECPAGGEADAIWGVETYTDDSSVCTAAVHVGLIDFDEGGTVEIEIAPGQESYESGTANDVESRSYGSWPGSFTFPEAPPGSGTFEVGAESWRQTALNLSVPMGSTREVACSGGGELGSVWGTGTYTADSSICTAAVHAGLIDQAEGGQVTIEVIAGLDAFEGSTANGVTSSAYGAFDPAFRFQVAAR
jgi:hypothetical protein